MEYVGAVHGVGEYEKEGKWWISKEGEQGSGELGDGEESVEKQASRRRR